LLGYPILKKCDNYLNLYTAPDYWLIGQQSNLFKKNLRKSFLLHLRSKVPQTIDLKMMKRGEITSPSVSIIIVNYNGGETLLRCLASVYLQEYTPCEVIVVDSGSRDGSVRGIVFNAFRRRHLRIST